MTLVGIGEDGAEGLSPAARAALEEAEVVMGPPRHLGLLPPLAAERVDWPVPFADGLPILAALRPRRTVVLASGDPFWHGAGPAIARTVGAGAWRCLPAPSTLSLAAARLGWPLERTLCLGLHAAPHERLHPHLAGGRRALVTLRDGAAVPPLAAWLAAEGFGATTLTVMEALGGPRERIRTARADAMDLADIAHPVVVGLDLRGAGLPLTPGLPDDSFESDGQITRAPVRALTLAALAPRPGERLWDVGAGSGSVALEWLRADPSTEAAAVEARPDRAARIRRNAARFGLDRLQVVEGTAPAALDGLPPPQAVFVGGGLDEVLLAALWSRLAPGTRLVANAVTLETEALLARWQAEAGGTLLRIELSEPVPLGPKRAWRAGYPITQWSVRR